jgi:hypothetical protein
LLIELIGGGFATIGRDVNDCDFLPKPKWMQWAMYNRYEQLYDHFEVVLDQGCMAVAAKLIAE